MKRFLLGFFTFVLLTAPAYATSHNAVHATNWLEQVLFFALPAAAIAVTYFRQKWVLFAASLVALFGPILWGLYRVASMDGPWNYVHFAKHHAEVGVVGTIIAIAALMAALILRPGHVRSRA